MTRTAAVKSGRLRRCQLIAEAVAVLCPECGEPQPSPGIGSEFWTPQDFDKKSGEFECTSCEARLLISYDPKAQFPK